MCPQVPSRSSGRTNESNRDKIESESIFRNVLCSHFEERRNVTKMKGGMPRRSSSHPIEVARFKGICARCCANRIWQWRLPVCA